jgi:hypothetical protein
MANADTIKAVITNIETILSAAPHSLRKIDIPDGQTESLPSFEQTPVYYLLYDGEAPEYEHGQKPGYIEASVIIVLVWLSTSISDARGKAIDWYHALRGALTVNALNVGGLVASKLVSKVALDKPQLDVQPAETKIFFKTTMRYREG